MTKPSKVLFLGSGPIVIGQAALDWARVDDLARADDFPKEGMRPGVVILGRWIADRSDAPVAVKSKVRNDLLTTVDRQSFKIGGNDGDINVAVFVSVAARIGTVEDDSLYRDAVFQEINKTVNAAL